MSIQDHLKDARRDAHRDMAELLFIAATGQRVLQAVAQAEVHVARDRLGLMLAAFRDYEVRRQITAGFAPTEKPPSHKEFGSEGGCGEVLKDLSNERG